MSRSLQVLKSCFKGCLKLLSFLGSCHTQPVALYEKEPSWVRGVCRRVGGVQKSDPGDVGAVLSFGEMAQPAQIEICLFFLEPPHALLQLVLNIAWLFYLKSLLELLG